jgi:hypothetical protein
MASQSILGQEEEIYCQEETDEEKINCQFISTEVIATEFVIPSLTALKCIHNSELGYKYKYILYI